MLSTSIDATFSLPINKNTRSYSSEPYMGPFVRKKKVIPAQPNPSKELNRLNEKIEDLSIENRRLYEELDKRRKRNKYCQLINKSRAKKLEELLATKNRLKNELVKFKQEKKSKSGFYNKTLIKNLKEQKTQLQESNRVLLEELELHKYYNDKLEANITKNPAENNKNLDIIGSKVNKSDFHSETLALLVCLDKFEKSLNIYHKNRNNDILQMDSDQCILDDMLETKLKKLKQIIKSY